ncbi:MAG: cytochrome b/b6 domain-containing protein [Bacteroidales bacterium]|nr:cytochrome b/b6 domain-containing protein [Bacteroidales bacterium]
MKKVYVYKGFERFWHWMQAALIFLLAATGFEIHGSLRLFGFEQAVVVHNLAAISLIVLIIFTVFWHFTTGEWRQYMPTFKNLKAQAEYYILGIFKNAPHPTRKTLLSKLNPLQRLVYLGLKVIFIPVMVVSGLLYMFYRYPQAGKIESLRIESVEPIALVHTFGAFILIAFVIVHLYLITTGHTLTSNLKAMLTGWEELEEEDEKEKNQNLNDNEK